MSVSVCLNCHDLSSTGNYCCEACYHEHQADLECDKMAQKQEYAAERDAMLMEDNGNADDYYPDCDY
jgi:hypothetical protein